MYYITLKIVIIRETKVSVIILDDLRMFVYSCIAIFNTEVLPYYRMRCENCTTIHLSVNY